MIPFNGFDKSVVEPIGPLPPVALTFSQLEILNGFVTVADAALGFPTTPKAFRGRDEPVTAVTVAGLRGASATFIVPTFALTDRVTGRPTALDAVAGLDIAAFAVVAVVVAVVVVALVELLPDVLETVRLTIFRVALLSLVGRGVLALVVVFRGSGALAR